MTTSPTFCTACGAARPPGAFCPSCGSPVGAPSPAVAQTEASPPPPLEQRSNGSSSGAAWLAGVAALTAVVVAGGAWLVLRPETPNAARAVTVVARSAPSPSASPAASPAAGQVAPPTGPDADALARAAQAARNGAARRAAARRLQAQKLAAGRIDQLLELSTAARSAVVAATQGLAHCALPADAAVAGLARVVTLRSRLLDQLEVVDFGPVSHGAQLRSTLAEAWSASLDADRSYLAWAENQDVYGACDIADTDYLAGNQSSARAVAAKRTFASLWNRYVAGPLHLSGRSDAEL